MVQQLTKKDFLDHKWYEIPLDKEDINTDFESMAFEFHMHEGYKFEIHRKSVNTFLLVEKYFRGISGWWQILGEYNLRMSSVDHLEACMNAYGIPMPEPERTSYESDKKETPKVYPAWDLLEVQAEVINLTKRVTKLENENMFRKYGPPSWGIELDKPGIPERMCSFDAQNDVNKNRMSDTIYPGDKDTEAVVREHSPSAGRLLFSLGDKMYVHDHEGIFELVRKTDYTMHTP